MEMTYMVPPLDGTAEADGKGKLASRYLTDNSIAGGPRMAWILMSPYAGPAYPTTPWNGGDGMGSNWHWQQNYSYMMATNPPPLQPEAAHVRPSYSLPSTLMVKRSDTNTQWHQDAELVGRLSEDGHTFSSPACGKKRACKSDTNTAVRPMLLLLERSLRCGGVHVYNFYIECGTVGKAGGVGFVFDTKLARRNISSVSSFFLNVHGELCFRTPR